MMTPEREDVRRILLRLSPAEQALYRDLGPVPESVEREWARRANIEALVLTVGEYETNRQRRRREAREWAAQAYVPSDSPSYALRMKTAARWQKAGKRRKRKKAA